MPTQNGLRLDDGDRATPRRQHARATRSFNRSTRWSVGRLLRRRRTLTWWRRTAFSMISSRRDRTASTATPAISLAHLCWASCDHSRPTQPTTQVRIRVTLGNRIPTWSMNEVAGGTDGIAQLPPWPHSDPQGSRHGIRKLRRRCIRTVAVHDRWPRDPGLPSQAPARRGPQWHDEEVAAYESGGTRAVAHPLGVAISKHPDQVSIGGGAGGSRQGGPSRAWLRRAQPTRCDPCGDPQAVRCSGTTRPSGSKKSERRSPACCGWPRPRSTPTPLLPPKVGFRVGFRGPEGRRPDECLSQLAVPTMNFLSGISDSNPRPPAWEQVEGLLISDESPVSTGS